MHRMRGPAPPSCEIEQGVTLSHCFVEARDSLSPLSLSLIQPINNSPKETRTYLIGWNWNSIEVKGGRSQGRKRREYSVE